MEKLSNKPKTKIISNNTNKKAIVNIQKTFRSFRFKKIQKENLLAKSIKYKNQTAQLIRIREGNFYSLINKKIKKLLRDLINIDSLDYYSIDNFFVTFDNLKFDHSKISKNMKKNRIKMHPVSIIKKSDSSILDFYWGEWDPKGKMEGFGIKIFSNGGFYFGTFKKNKMDGIGIYFFPERSKDLLLLDLLDKKNQFKFKVSCSINYIFQNTFSSQKDFITNLNNIKIDYYIYIGEFEEDKLQGYGQIYQGNNDRFYGKFNANEITCEGEYCFKNED